MEVALNLMALNGLFNLLSFAVSVVMYILVSMGMYTIAKRRGIYHPWLAWIPVGNVWILGSISDQYQYSAKGRKTNRRKVLLGLQIALSVVAVILMVAVILFVVQLAVIPEYAMFPGLQGISYGYHDSYATVGESVSVVMFALVILFVSVVLMVVSVVFTVFAYISYYDLYMSCNPSNATVFLVLSIFFSFLSNIFVFVCRHKDEGMRPQYQQMPVWQYQPQSYQQPGYYPPQPGYPQQPMQPPAEPTAEQPTEQENP